MSELVRLLRAARDARIDAAVLVTVASVKGSAPRPAGTRMIVSAHDVLGTIGGGHLEFTAIDVARRQLAGGNVATLQRFALGASLGQCCGGVVNLLFEPMTMDAAWVSSLLARDVAIDIVIVTAARGGAGADKLIVDAIATQGTLGSTLRDDSAAAMARKLLGNRGPSHLATLDESGNAPRDSFFFDFVPAIDFHVVLFGAGHVGRALANVLGGLPCDITWVDTRDGAFPASCPPNARAVVTDAPEAEVDTAPAGAFYLVMTHNHPLDEQLTERILRRADFAYFGLIGSASKRRQFERRLLARGVDPAMLARMTCPIGIDGIGGKEPGVIAVAVAAQVLHARAALAVAPHALSGLRATRDTSMARAQSSMPGRTERTAR